MCCPHFATIEKCPQNVKMCLLSGEKSMNGTSQVFLHSILSRLDPSHHSLLSISILVKYAVLLRLVAALHF